MKRLRSGSTIWAALPLPLIIGLSAEVRAAEAPSSPASTSLAESSASPAPSLAESSASPPPSLAESSASPPPSLAESSASPPPSSGVRPGKRSHDGFFLQLSLGPVYLHESWSPTAGGAGATFGGWGTSLETSVGRSVRPGLIVGGRWQIGAVVDPTESYLGATTAADGTARLVDVIGAFVDYYRNPRRGLHLGGAVGVVIATNLDTEYHAYETSWGPAISAHVGYEVFLSSRCSVGALAQLLVYRYSTTEAGVSSVSDGLLPTFAAAFTFN